MACDAQSLIQSANCIYCGSNAGYQPSIWIALLAQKAGVAADATLASVANPINSTIPREMRNAVIISLLCQLASTGCDSITIVTQSGQLEGNISEGYVMSIVIYQTAVWVGASTDAQSLVNLANVLDPTLRGLEFSIAIYLLAKIAGVSTDPNTLLKSANCLGSCLSGMLEWSAIISLLCTLASGVTPPPPPTGNHMLYENGDRMLYENGDLMVYQ